MLKKYAVVFPTIKTHVENLPANVSHKSCLAETKKTFSDTYDYLDGLLGYIVERNRTNELSKRLDAQKRVLDATLDNLVEQEKIKTAEEAKRLKSKLKVAKKEMLSQIEQLEIQAQDDTVVYTVEEYIQENKIFRELINKEKIILDEIQPFINSLSNDLEHRRDYVQYCEMQRRSMDLINKYLYKTI